MSNSDRRQFMQNVGSGMLIAGLGSGLAAELGVATAPHQQPTVELDYGSLTPWVRMMQELNPDKLQREMITSLTSGKVNLEELTSAAALANSETFGGQDYVGYHAEMALVPALQMSHDLPMDRRALPVLKVLYRNSSRIQSFGPGKKILKPIAGQNREPVASVDRFGAELRRLVRAADMDKAEQLFAQCHGQQLRHRIRYSALHHRR